MLQSHGNLVKRDMADHELVVGKPCRRIGWVSKCGGLGEDFRRRGCRIFTGRRFFVLQKGQYLLNFKLNLLVISEWIARLARMDERVG